AEAARVGREGELECGHDDGPVLQAWGGPGVGRIERRLFRKRFTRISLRARARVSSSLPSATALGVERGDEAPAVPRCTLQLGVRADAAVRVPVLLDVEARAILGVELDLAGRVRSLHGHELGPARDRAHVELDEREGP